jgi:hypothetical protein
MLKRVPKREGLFILTLIVIVVTSLVVWQMNRKDGEYKIGVNSTYDNAVNTAKMLYDQQKKAKVDFSDGPCLTNALMEDWVADIVHVPRSEVDNDPDNQCIAFLEGGAHHFVELDLNGNVVRVK